MMSTPKAEINKKPAPIITKLEGQSNLIKVLENNPDGIIVVDGAGVVLYANPAAITLFNGAAADITGQNFGYPVISGKKTEIQLLQDDVTHTAEMRVVDIDWDDKPALLASVRDITKKKIAEEKLRTSEKLFSTVYNSAPVGIANTNPEGKFVQCNQMFNDILGYDDCELVGKSFKDITYPDDLSESVSLVEEIREGKRDSFCVEKRYRTKDGNIVWGNIAVSGVRDGNGELLYHIVTLIDITRKKYAIKELSRREQNYRGLADSITDVFFAMDRDLRCTYWNKATENLTGISAENVFGKHLHDIFPHSRYTRRTERVYREVIRTGNSLTLETTFDLKGKKLYFEGHVYPAQEGISVFFKDITERKKAEEDLKKSEAHSRFLADIVEKTSVAVGIGFPDGRLGTVNHAFCRLTGYSVEELKTIDWAKALTPPEYNALEEEKLAQLTATGEPVTYQKEYIRKDGTRVPIELIVHLVRDDRGNAQYYYSFINDIAERKKAEEELKESEQRYRNLFENMIDGYAFCQMIFENGKPRDFIYKAVNKSFESLTGLKNVVGKKVTEIIPGIRETNPGLFEIYGRVALTGRPERFETYLDQLNIWFLISVYSSERGMFTAVFENITERKQLEETLSQSEKRFRRFFEDEPVYCYMVSPDGIILDVNKAATSVLGYSKEELVGKPLSMIYSPESLPPKNKLFSQLTGAGKIENEELTIITKQGQKRFVILSVSAIRDKDGNILHSISVQQDITERKQAEQKFKGQQELTNRILASMPNPVLVINTRLQILLVNQACLKTFNIKECRLEGSPITEILPLEGLGEAISKTFAEGKPQLNLEFTYQADTDPKTFIGQILPIHSEEVLLTLTDVTAERDMQQQLYHTRSLALIGEMASGVAHEINNPLTAVIGFAELLAQQDVPKSIKEDVNIIHDGAQRIAGIVKRLLTFSRQYKPERGYININDVIRVTLNLRKYQLETANIEVSTQLDPELPQTMADAGQLQQVFLNLVINAEAAMKSAKGRGKLLLKTKKTGGMIRIFFRDNGPGIARENLSKIFNPFFTTKVVGEGTGLGLSICHGIMSEHNGRISVKSEPGKGATFIVELPIAGQTGKPEILKAARDESKKPLNAKILAVDDESGIRQYLNKLLSDQGYEVHCSDSAEDALKMLESGIRYNLILLDIKMPGISGIEMYQRLSEIAQSLANRVVFLTGDVMAPDTKQFISVTKAPYITKPFKAEELKKAISNILEKSK